jgi:chromosome segregation ATPase
VQHAVDNEVAKRTEMESQLDDEMRKRKDAQRLLEDLEARAESLAQQLQWKSAECEEYHKTQANLSFQLKQRNEDAAEQHEEFLLLKTKWQDLDAVVPALEADSKASRDRLRTSESELQALRKEVDQLRPLVASSEPDLRQLRADQEAYNRREEQQGEELTQLRARMRLVTELDRELRHSDELSEREV